MNSLRSEVHSATSLRTALATIRFPNRRLFVQLTFFGLGFLVILALMIGLGSKGQVSVGESDFLSSANGLPRSLGSAGSCATGTQYCSRTDLRTASLPDPLPSVGGLKGANRIVIPPDFNNPIVRITDSQSEGREGGNKAFDVSSSAEVHAISRNNDRIVVSDQGTFMLPFAFDTSTMQATRMYVSVFPSTKGMIFSGRGFPVWSYTQPYILCQLQNNKSNDPAIVQYDFANAKKPPSPEQLVDLSSCVAGLAKNVKGWAEDLTVSDDDQTFATSIAAQGGSQGSAVLAIVWNRTNGCRIWETDTGKIIGSYGGAPTGTVNMTDRFTIHNLRISKGGDWLKVVGQRCLSGACSEDHTRVMFWNIRTLEVNVVRYSSPSSCGHGTEGFGHMINSCGGNGYGAKAFWVRSLTDLNSVSILNSSQPATNQHPFDVHISWTNADLNDSSPFFSSSWIGQLEPVFAWDNEIIGVDVTGAGTVHRFAHNYITGKSVFFASKYGIGSVSQDGRWFIWSSDWAATLGNVNLRSQACSVGVNCRADVFMVKLQ